MALGFREGVPRRHLVRQGRHGGAGNEAGHHRIDLRARQGIRAAVQRRPDHPGREVQQGRRRLGQVLGQARRGDDDPHLLREEGRGRQGQADQLHLHDEPFRRPWFAHPDEAARRHARADGQAVGRDHRVADHLELQGRPDRPRILLLDARRPQGSRRHGAEDGQFRLSDAPPRRRGAGRHHLDRRLRLAGRHQDAGDPRRRAGSWRASPSASSAAPRPRT